MCSTRRQRNTRKVNWYTEASTERQDKRSRQLAVWDRSATTSKIADQLIWEDYPGTMPTLYCRIWTQGLFHPSIIGTLFNFGTTAVNVWTNAKSSNHWEKRKFCQDIHNDLRRVRHHHGKPCYCNRLPLLFFEVLLQLRVMLMTSYKSTSLLILIAVHSSFFSNTMHLAMLLFLQWTFSKKQLWMVIPSSRFKLHWTFLLNNFVSSDSHLSQIPWS